MAKSSGLNFNLPSVDDLFSTEEERAEARLEKVVNLSPAEISDFPNHPFKVRMDEAMREMTESVKQYGVLVPALVRPKPEGGYEMVAGHRRKKAADLAGLAEIPCIVRQLTDDEATIIMVDSNLQREQILPSEKAFAYVADLFYGTGCFDSEYSPLFLSGALRLTEGCHVTEGNSGIILYEGLAEKYGLSLGDTLEIKNGNPDDPLVECEIAGLFEVIADDDDEQATMAKPSTLYDYENYIFTDMDTMSAVSAPYTASNGNGITSVDFFVSDAAKLESIVQEVQNSTSIDWDSYYITVNNEVYERISSSIEDTTTLVMTLIVVITVVSMVLIILILSMSIRSRKRETGILLAVGIAKPAVILQYLLETLLIAVVAFPLAYLSSKQVAGALGTLFGKAAKNVIVTPEHFMLVAIVGGVLLVAAVLVSSISTMRLKPKQILSQME